MERGLLATLLLLLLFVPKGVYSQEDGYDEVSVYMNVQSLGSLEIPAVIHREEAYLSVK